MNATTLKESTCLRLKQSKKKEVDEILSMTQKSLNTNTTFRGNF